MDLQPGRLALVPLLLAGDVIAQGQSSTETMSTVTGTMASQPNIAAIVAPSVTLGVLAIVGIALLLFFCVIRKKRQTEGTYRPSAEEQTGAPDAHQPDALKLPKEERLI